MKCPNCGGAMKQVKADAHYYGREIVVDQCEKCGGLWFDKNEFYGVKIGEAMELEKIDLNKLAEISAVVNEAMACPKDGRPLVRYANPYGDKEIRELRLFTCRHCEGFWFNRGEFTKYQGAMAEDKIKENNYSSLAKAIVGLDSYRNELTQMKELGSVARGVVNYGGIPQTDTGNWGFDLLADVLAIITHRRY